MQGLGCGGGAEEEGGEVADLRQGVVEGEGGRQIPGRDDTCLRVVLQTRVGEVRPQVRLRVVVVAGRAVRLGGEQGQHLAEHVDAQGADGEDLAAEVEFAVAEGGEEEGAGDVALGDEVAEVRCYDAGGLVGGFGLGAPRGEVGVVVVVSTPIFIVVVVFFLFFILLFFIALPPLKNPPQPFLAPEQPHPIPLIAHPRLQHPPLPLPLLPFTTPNIPLQTPPQLPRLHQRLLQKLRIINLKPHRLRHVPPQLSPEHGVLDREVPHRLPEVVLADQRFADDVGVRK